MAHAEHPRTTDTVLSTSRQLIAAGRLALDHSRRLLHETNDLLAEAPTAVLGTEHRTLARSTRTR